MQCFCDDLANTSFVRSPSIAADLYDDKILDLVVLDKQAPLICERADKTAGLLSDSYCMAKSIR